MMKRLCLVLLAAALSWVSATAYAASDDAVIVVTHGGVRDGLVFDLRERGGQLEATRLGSERLIPDDLGALVAVGDIKVLPDGSYLVADVSGRGFAQVDGGATSLQLDPAGNRPDVRSASVATYGGLGTPLRVLYTDDARAAVGIFDVASGRDVFLERYFLGTGQPRFAQAAVLPGGKLAVGVDWRGLDLSTIDIIDISASGSLPELTRQIASRTYDQAPGGRVDIRPEIIELRDLQVLDGASEALLVTTRFGLYALDGAGEVRWRLETASTPQLSGELARAVALPSGRLALLSFEPGVWTSPHPHHRLHWIDASDGTIVATSDIIEAAPRALDALEGHGGTGTFGFNLGLDQIGQGRIETLELSTPLSAVPPSLAQGEELVLEAVVRNGGALSVSIRAIELVAFAGGCDGELEGPRVLREITASILGPGEVYRLDESVTIDASYVGRGWCVRMQLQDVDGSWFEPTGARATFEVRAPSDDMGLAPLPRRQLGNFDPNNPDPGDMGADGGNGLGLGAGESSCGCRSIPPQRKAPWWALAAGVTLLGWRRRRRA